MRGEGEDPVVTRGAAKQPMTATTARKEGGGCTVTVFPVTLGFCVQSSQRSHDMDPDCSKSNFLSGWQAFRHSSQPLWRLRRYPRGTKEVNYQETMAQRRRASEGYIISLHSGLSGIPKGNDRQGVQHHSSFCPTERAELLRVSGLAHKI